MIEINEYHALEKKLYHEMKTSLQNVHESQNIGISFSGGVDSTILAKIAQELGFDTMLLTMGFADSHDVEFSKNISNVLNIPHKIELIDPNTFSDVAYKIWDTINIDNLSWNENCIAFYYVAKLAKQNNITTVITANGIDELFCGYNSYRNYFDEGIDAILALMDEKLDNEIRMMKAVNQITSEFGVKIVQPFLSNQFIEFAKTIPLEYKIKDKDDLLRKHIVRSLGMSLGVPTESAMKQKKAMQYGSLIHKNLIKVKKSWNTKF